MRDSGYEAYFEGGPSGAPEKRLEYQKTRYIKTEDDCALVNVTNKTECAAYVIFSSMTKVNWPDLPIYSFYFDVPAWQTSFKNITLKFKKVSWKF